ncbi:hypothetical protein M3Y98_00578200 [Aphelenchoides besseyi]|nr:hypothetical protein M3Y98_00578200 [Aphelenchoides besseyi]KAI6193987.1 hypothetical protein M3Y96_01077300 [Aphelenchoides besseyi]
MNKQLFFIVAVAFVLIALMQVQLIDAKSNGTAPAGVTIGVNSTASSMFSSIGLVVVPLIQFTVGAANF